MAVNYTILNIDGDSYNTKYEFSFSGETFYLKPAWNDRGGWQVSLYDSSDTLLVGSHKLIPYQEIFKNVHIPDGYSGYIICMDTIFDDSDDNLTISNFGTGRRFQLWYFTEDQYTAFIEDLEDYVEELEDMES